MNIAVLGPKGTFSDVAALDYIKSINQEMTPIYYKTIKSTFLAIGEECEVGIIPVENTIDGYVHNTLDLLISKKVNIIGEISVPVQFSLILNDSLDEVKKIYVQFKAKGQCYNFLGENEDKEIYITESNMESYELFKKDTLPAGAIIPSHIFKKGNLGIDNVTDQRNNETRFLVIKAGEFEGSNDLGTLKASLAIMIKNDHPGILYEILESFKKRNLNLVSIMSRPTKEGIGKYHFFIDISLIDKEREVFFEAIKEIEKNGCNVVVLGIYKI